jgi:bifunctional lysine-specific demethylase and histidyl-hydroxylase NO66
VFQTHGSKIWEVHAGPDEAQAVQSVVLEPGLSMYLPSGTPHAARAQDAVSLHVTVGVNQVTWRHLLERVLADAMERTGGQHLPAGYLDDPAVLADELPRRVEELVTGLRDLDAMAVADAQVRRFLTGRTLWQRGGLRDRIATRQLSDTSRLRRRPGHPCVLVPDGDRLRVLLGDRELVMPVRLAAALEAVQGASTFRPADLAGHLDEQSRLVVCRRLVREGLLEALG